MDPLVTIVITSYNYGEHVGDAVRSALSQTYRNIEVLVLDNASTDNSLEVIRSFSDDRLRVVVHPENVGIQRNHNEGIRLARGEFVVLLAADDMLLPTLVEDILAYRRAHPDVDIVYASVAIMDKAGNVVYYFDHPSFDGAESYDGRNEFASLLTRDSCMYLPTVLFPKKIFEELGLLDETLTIVLDYEYDIRMASVGKKFAFLSKPVALIRFHGENRSGVKNFVKTGGQLREFCTLLERYTQPKYHDRLAGYGAELLAMANRKVAEFQVPFPAEFEAQRTELEPLVKRAIASIATVPEISGAVMRGEGLISVIVPFAGSFGPLQRALQSLQNQEYKNWEAIVVADCAPDPGALIASMSLADKVRVARTSRFSTGPSGARNLGLMGATGEVVAYLDSDNRFEPGYLGVLARRFADPTVMVTAARTRLAVVAENGDVLESVPTAFGPSPDGRVSTISNRLPLNAVAHRRSCVSPTNRFHPGLGLLEDWEFLIRLSSHYYVTALACPGLALCIDVAGRGHHLFGRKNSQQWTEFAMRLQDIYAAYPPRNESEQALRSTYASSLQGIIQAGVNSLGNAAGVVAFVNALAGPATALEVTAR